MCVGLMVRFPSFPQCVLWACSALMASLRQPFSRRISVYYPQVIGLACILSPSFNWVLSPVRAEMFFHCCQTLLVFILCFLSRALVYSIRKCGQELCRDGQVCCAQGNNTTVATCCNEFVDKTYYNIAMVTRKLSGMLILLLLFAVGYFVQRVLCSRSRQRTPSPNGHPTITTSQELLVESCAPESLVDPSPAAQLPSYEECKRLPTYEETVRDGSTGPPESSLGRAT